MFLTAIPPGDTILFVMNYENLIVTLTDADTTEGYADMLRQAGFVHILVAQADETVRQTLVRTLAEGYEYIVTVSEKDGFSPSDVARVADAVTADGEALYAGARAHKEKKSLPAVIFGFLSGVDANDIETSLYGMSAATCLKMTQMKGKEGCFLMNVPLEARANDLQVTEVMTDAQTHTQPGWNILTKTFKLYFVFIKFSISAMIAYIVDIGTFLLFEHVFMALASEFKILAATVLSRILCSIATYILNRGAVFKSHAKSAGAIVRFIILSVGQLLLSWLLVWGIGSLLGGSDLANTGVKVVVDLLIFIASFPLQRDWVFKKTEGILN